MKKMAALWFSGTAAVCLMFAGCGGGGGGDSANSTQPTTATSISGKVYIVGTTNPLSGVVISSGSSSSTTGADGSYTLSNVSPGNYNVSAILSGYNNYSNSMSISTGSNSLNIFMTASVQGVSLSGYIKDSRTNAPIVGAKVTAASMTDTTDASGHYQLPNIPQGNNTITVTHADYSTKTSDVYMYSANKQFDLTLDSSKIVLENCSGNITVYDYPYPAFVHVSVDVTCDVFSPVAIDYLNINNTNFIPTQIGANRYSVSTGIVEFKLLGSPRSTLSLAALHYTPPPTLATGTKITATCSPSAACTKWQIY